MRFIFSHRATFGVLIALWIVGLVVGAHALWRYSATPGRAGHAPESWPPNSLIQPSRSRPTLVMLAHPRCPCTRASLAELERIMARGDADAWVLFLRPDDAEPGWEKTELWEMATAIPRVRAAADTDGVAAKLFGAKTSGHVLFYDASGVLRFSGGITAARGHEGPSAGGDAVLSALRGTAPIQNSALTFGCSLQTPESSK